MDGGNVEILQSTNFSLLANHCSPCFSLQYNYIDPHNLDYKLAYRFFTGRGQEARARYENQYLLDKNLDPWESWREIFSTEKEVLLERVSTVFKPVFNIAWRSFFCRCILMEVQERSPAPRLDFEVDMICPRYCQGKHPDDPRRRSIQKSLF